jgi:hypothetical protein
MLSNLFGGGTTNGIVEAIARYTGLGSGATGKVIGMITPLIFGALKRQKTSMGLDAGGLANLLSSQKSSFLSAMPSGLSGMLSSVPGLSALTGTAGAATTAGREYAASAADSARETGYAARDAGYAGTEPARRAADHRPSSSGWVLPLAAFCVLVALSLWWWAAGRNERRAARRVTTPPPPAQTTPAPNQTPEDMATPAGARLGPAANQATGLTTQQVSNVFTSATDTFGQVHDAASAEAAVPKVQAINKQLDAMDQSMKSLPAGTRATLASNISTWRDKLQPVTDKALATPGAGEKLRPSVDEMYRKIDAMTATSAP